MFTSSYMRGVHAIARKAKEAYQWHYHTCLAFAFRCKAQNSGTKVKDTTIVNIRGQLFRRLNGVLIGISDHTGFNDLAIIRTRSKNELRQRRLNIAAAMQSYCNGGWTEVYQSGSIPKYGLPVDQR